MNAMNQVRINDRYLTKAKLVTQKYRNSTHWFFSGLWRYPVLLISSTFLLVLTTLLSIFPGILLGLAIDVLKNDGFTQYFKNLILIIICFGIINWGVTFLASYIWGLSAYRFERDARQDFFEVLEEHSMAFHDTHESGVLLSMGMNEIGQIRFAYHPSLRQFFTSILSIILTCTYFFIRIPITQDRVFGGGSWEIGLGVTFGFIIYFALAWQYAHRIGPIHRDLSIELGNVSAASQEVFRGIEVVRSFDNEQKEENKFEKKSTLLAEKTKQEGYLGAFYWPTLILLLITTVAFGFGLWMNLKGMMSPGQLTAILTLLLQLVSNNLMIPARLLSIQAGSVNAKRIWEIMTFKDPLVEPFSSIEPDWSKTIKFDNVSFKYPGMEKYVLKNVSFEIPAGTRIALIGGPGSGKSTILKLLLRLYDTTEGEILIDGYRYRDIKSFDIRKNVTLVEQDIFLFSASIKDNILFSTPTASMEEVKLAAQRAQVSRFIEATPEGYETFIGERGVTLSGGQRQRIAIARALLANPKILLLDDSTSAVDIKTEIKLRLAMQELIKGRTSIIVTQRLSTLVDSDMIIFIDKGEIVDIGNHSELLERCSKYRFMLLHLPVGTKVLQSIKSVEVTDEIGGSK